MIGKSRDRAGRRNVRRWSRPAPGAPDVVPVRLSPALWAALLGAVTALALASPVAAQPVAVPDTGARPVPAGGLQLPGAAPTTGPPVPPNFVPSTVQGPLASQIYASETEVALLGAKLIDLEEQQTEAESALHAAELALRQRRTALLDAQRAAENTAASAIKDAAALPPGEYRGDLHGWDALSRLQRGEPGTSADAANREVSLAAAAEQEAHRTYTAALARVDALRAEFGSTEGTFKQRETALLELKARNTQELVTIERQREAAEQEIGRGIDGVDGITGTTAHPRAVAALDFALRQLGKPYLWGAEGPSRYDCSGLMWAAYRSPGADYFSLPRVAADQYWATRGKTVDRSELLPGDLIFFASGSSWTTVHHVGMYVGDGQMVHAPTTGDVVKVATVWWSRFYRATRVFDAVAAPTTTPTPTPTPTTPATPKPTPSTPATPKPTPTGSASPTPTPTGGPTPTPTGTPSTPAPTPSTSVSPTTTPTTVPGTPDPDETGTPDPDETGTGTPTATPSGVTGTASASPSASATATGSPSAGPQES
ncbi:MULTISPECIES: C40 family peptidase [unclassified Solwaraspora]|uniref:C40 family peptidase n=1 Tax=unclassified Solwaraspora TaxID=2627926 RepID=UPI00259B5B67|nr:C40 family peptidase [Solwaraspora sp. WMMA2056]WJK41915.1 NlpC/P60 family protein [Solwaraspora sp. WMMA2056]